MGTDEAVARIPNVSWQWLAFDKTIDHSPTDGHAIRPRRHGSTDMMIIMDVAHVLINSIVAHVLINSIVALTAMPPRELSLQEYIDRMVRIPNDTTT